MRYFLYTVICSATTFGICISQPAATFSQNGNSVSLAYKGKLILSGRLTDDSMHFRVHEQTKVIDNCTHQIITITSGDFKTFEMDGVIEAGNESIPCESEPRDRGLKIVRHASGRSNSLLNNAIYSRNEDWLISFDASFPRMSLKSGQDNKHEFIVKGWEIVIRFRPYFFRDHRKLPFFTPSDRPKDKKPIVGWCSWFAYYDKITEKDIKKAADILGAKLKPFGLEYLQIDDGYQQVPIGLPETWINPNSKFPSGLRDLSGYIRSRGLKPGIWTNVSFADSLAAHKNRDLFVLDTAGRPAWGNWVGYVMDGSNPYTVDQLISPVYRALRESGWQYFKLDALRHLKYEGYNSYSDFFGQKGVDRNEAFRNAVMNIRMQIGDDNFLLACWGIRPELTGIVDGCRIGNDGYSYAGLAQFNSYNNIVWQNDPDHIELTETEAYRSCTATSLTGSLFMLTDKPEKYETSPLIDAAIRSIPVLHTKPCQMYDVDPSRSSLIDRADLEMSGSGPRSFDASTSTTTGLFSLEINKPYENWLLLGRVDNRDKIIPLTELGLNGEKEYLVFEFWTKKFYGIIKKQLELDNDIDSGYGCQVFCFREKLAHPQIAATSRHITCGGVELSNVVWENSSLSGTSQLIPNDEYILYIYEPANNDQVTIETDDNSILIKSEKEANIRKIYLHAEKGGNVNWKITYK